MYFRKYRFPKTWLDKWLKSRVSEHPQTDNAANKSKHLSILISAPLQSLLITGKVVASEKVSFSDTKNLRVFFNTLTVYDKHYLLNRDMLTEPIQVQLSEKQKKFSEFCFAFSKSILNFKHLPKKMTLMYFPKNRFPKTCLDEWLKSLVSQYPQTDNKENGSKHSSNLNDSAFTIFIIHCEGSSIGRSLLQ